jgi:transmembrane sensor
MSTHPSRNDLATSILEEAAAWVIEFNEGEVEAGQRAEFNHWIRRSPEHVRAYLEIAAAWEESARLDSTRRLDPHTLVAQALEESNVVPLGGATSRPPAPKAGSPAAAITSRFAARHLAVAASLLAIIGVSSAWFVLRHDTYSTGTGEQRSLVLSDGSTIELNSRSRLRIDFSTTERVVDLLQGQALFQVSKDPSRPFIVRSDQTRVRAVGTQFDVYRKSSGTTVTVVEGKVTVGSPPVPSLQTPNEAAAPGTVQPAPLLLSAGEQVTVAPNVAPRPVRTNVANATAWTQRKLVFEETPLTEAVAEFNRYNTRRMVIDDASLGNFHVRGTFSAGNPERLAEFLHQRFGVSVHEGDVEIRISRADP